MKVSFWDILAVLGVLALCAVAAGLVMVFVNPQNPLNPFPPATLPARVIIPSDTPTLPRLPATWTVVASPITEVEMGYTEEAPQATEDNLPTLTPMPTFTATFTATPEMTSTYTPAPNQALWIAQTPADGTVFSPGQEFDMIWKIQNTGILSWTSRYGYRYVSGEPIHQKSEYGLRKTVPAGGIAEIIVDMNAPKTPGSYRTEWAMYDDGGNKFYTFFFFFVVK